MTTRLDGTKRISGILLVAILASAAFAGQSPTPAELKTFTTTCRELRQGTIDEIRYRLRGLERASDTSGALAAKAKRQREVLEADLADLEAGRRLLVPTLRYPLAAGNIGLLPGGAIYVEQVLEDGTLLGRASFTVNVLRRRNGAERPTVVRRAVRLLIRDVDTKHVQPTADLPLSGAFYVAKRRGGDGPPEIELELWPFDTAAVKRDVLGERDAQLRPPAPIRR